jgi:DUF4097 and DUF4098 domain-containing protein YvlB
MSRRLLALALCAVVAPAFAGHGDIDKVNGSIHLRDGENGGDLSTVNGSVSLGDHALAEDVETVNGGIELGADAHARSLETVNGGISLGARAQVQDKIETVNGSITLERGAEALGMVSNVNGRIRLDAAHVGGGLETVSGDIEVGADSKVDGGILVDENKGMHWGSKPKPPRIVIGPHAVVGGKLVFKREVRLYVSDSAQVGAIEGASAQRFSGTAPTE